MNITFNFTLQITKKYVKTWFDYEYIMFYYVFINKLIFKKQKCFYGSIKYWEIICCAYVVFIWLKFRKHENIDLIVIVRWLLVVAREKLFLFSNWFHIKKNVYIWRLKKWTKTILNWPKIVFKSFPVHELWVLVLSSSKKINFFSHNSTSYGIFNHVLNILRRPFKYLIVLTVAFTAIIDIFLLLWKINRLIGAT